MKKTPVVFSLGLIALLTVLITGCVGPGGGNLTPAVTPSGTAIPVGYLVVNESQNNATVFMNRTDHITVRLSENPSTGFQWNLTTTGGLRILKDEYTPATTSANVVGAGGIHLWEISADGAGEGKISAIYRRSWEPISGNETTFRMTVNVR